MILINSRTRAAKTPKKSRISIDSSWTSKKKIRSSGKNSPRKSTSVRIRSRKLRIYWHKLTNWRTRYKRKNKNPKNNKRNSRSSLRRIRENKLRISTTRSKG